MEPTVDVILPFHRYGKYLISAIKSVLESEGVQIRLILINDVKCKQNYIEEDIFLVNYLKNVDANFIVLNSPQNGYAFAINCAKPFIESQYVALMNSDDLIEASRFKFQIQSLQSNFAEVAIGQIKKFQGVFRLPTLAGKFDVSNYNFSLLLLGAYGADASILSLRDTWVNLMQFNETARSSDWVTALDVFPNVKVVGVKDAIYWYRSHAEQITKNEDHKLNNFDEIYPHWLNVSQKLCLPPIPKNLAQIIAAPWSRSKLNGDEISVVEKWGREFEKLQTDKQAKKEVNGLLKRRICASLSPPQAFLYAPHISLRMAIEFLYMRLISCIS